MNSQTQVARSLGRDHKIAKSSPLQLLQQSVPHCQRCPELRSYCADIASAKRKSFANWTYWAKPVPSFGDHRAKIMIVGLAPAAHGANRTGRMFTGDRSGDFLFAALHRAGLANQPISTHINDGLKLKNIYITAACRCAPPANKPTPAQLSQCSRFLVQEIEILDPKVIICLGEIAWNAAMKSIIVSTTAPRTPRPKFGHGAEIAFAGTTILGCYHVSQQNTFTGRLTNSMLDAVLRRAIGLSK